VLENRVSRRIFGLKREEVTGGWSKLYDELHNLHSSLFIKYDENGTACSTHGRNEKCVKLLKNIYRKSHLSRR
jgi:hypothetical protein